MTEFSTKIDRLKERLRRGITQCDHIEQRACHAEERLLILNESIETLTRLIEVSLLILISSDKEKYVWLQLVNNEPTELTNPMLKQFFVRLELYLRRSIIDHHEKEAYIQALSSLQTSSCISSRSFLIMKEKKKIT